MERFLVPIVILLVIMALYTVLRGQNLAELWGQSREGSLTIMLAFDAMFVSALTWVPMISDYTRYGQTRRGSFSAAIIGSVSVALFMLFVGQVSAVALGNSNALEAMVGVGSGFGVMAFFVAMFATIATAALIMYSSSMALLNVFPQIPLRLINLFTGIIVIVASVTVDLIGNVLVWLSFLGVMLIPLFAVVLVDYYIVHRQHYDVSSLYMRQGIYWGNRGFNLVGYAAWIVGAIVYVVVHNASSGLGGSVASFILTGGLYWLLTSLTTRRTQKSGATENNSRYQLNNGEYARESVDNPAKRETD